MYAYGAGKHVGGIMLRRYLVAVFVVCTCRAQHSLHNDAWVLLNLCAGMVPLGFVAHEEPTVRDTI